MEIEVTKQMIDATFDFIEGRRTKKESSSVVLRGVRGAKFPESLLREPNEETPLSCYMDGEKQAVIATKFNMPKNMPVVYGRVGQRYARQIELYWTYTAVMEFIKPVCDELIENIFPTGKDFDPLIVRCYAQEITTIGDFLNTFVRYEVMTVKKRLIRAEIEVFDAIFANIRAACYALL